MDLAAGSVARGLVAAGGVPGDRVGILSRNNADFLIALFGINAAGAAACPLPLPTSVGDLGGYAARMTAIMAAAGIRRVVVGARSDATARRISALVPDVEFLPAAALSGPDVIPLPPVAPDDLAAATRAIAARAERLDPVLATTAFIREDRGGKVFLDSTRAGGATVVAA